MRTAAILASGDELVYGFVEERNSSWLAGRLLDVGIEPVFCGVVADNAALYGETLHWALAATDVVITTGGLGPTVDDLTRQVVARVTGKRLISVSEAEQHIRDVLQKLGVPVRESELRQALIPEGATPIHNRYGTACGFALQVGKTHLFCLSGVPQEMEQMFEDGVLPLLKGTGRPLFWRRFNTMGLSESELQAIVRGVALPKGVRVAYTASDYLISLTVYAHNEKLLDESAEKVKSAIPPKRLISEGKKALNEALFEALQAKGATFAVAESFTGGLLLDRITDVAGISAYLRGGVVAYSAEAKSGVLGVAKETIEKFGVYSLEVAEEMARCAAKRFGADFAISTTGVAGPQPAGPGLPAGLAFVGVYGNGTAKARRFTISGPRRSVKSRAANIALNILRLALLEPPK